MKGKQEKGMEITAELLNLKEFPDFSYLRMKSYKFSICKDTREAESEFTPEFFNHLGME